MARGRPRKPTALKVLEGTARADDLGCEPQPAGKPIMPRGMDSEAKKLWRAVVPELTAMRIAAGIDAHELQAMCEWWARYRHAAKRLAAADDSDFYRWSIAAGMCWKNFSSIASKFGLNPADRSRLRVLGNDKPQSKFAGLIA
jgi:P27 family predicted phage terminase small subunit